MEKFTEEETQEIINKLQDQTDSLVLFIKSHGWCLHETLNVITFFLACISNIGQLDEEDLRTMFRNISILKDKIKMPD